MTPLEIAEELEAKAGIKKAFLALLAGSTTINLVLAIALVMADRTHREVMVPPEVNRSFWIEDNKASASYLEQMGLFVLRLALDATPLSADYQSKQMLRYASPEYYGVLEKYLTANAQRMQRDNISTMVAVRGVTVDEAKQHVVFDSMLRTVLGDKTVSEVPKKYEVGFSMRQGRIYLNRIRELDERGVPVSATDEERTR